MKRAIILFIPWTRKFLPMPTNFDELRKKGVQFYVNAVEYHKKTFQEDSPRYTLRYKHKRKKVCAFENFITPTCSFLETLLMSI